MRITPQDADAITAPAAREPPHGVLEILPDAPEDVIRVVAR